MVGPRFYKGYKGGHGQNGGQEGRTRERGGAQINNTLSVFEKVPGKHYLYLPKNACYTHIHTPLPYEMIMFSKRVIDYVLAMQL